MAEARFVSAGEALALPRVGNELGERAQRYLAAIASTPITDLVPNAAGVEVRLILVDDLLVPITINGGHSADCYIVSPQAHYVRYGLHEVGMMAPSALTRAMSAGLRTLGWVGRRTAFDKAISINNWLISTNPPLDLKVDQLVAVIDLLVRAYPDHAVTYRGVADSPDDTASVMLRELGFRMVVNREVHLFDPKTYLVPGPARARFKRKRRVESDIALIRGGVLSLREPRPESDEEMARIRDLYRMLYVEKYSPLTPQYTPLFFRLLCETKAVSLRVLILGEEPVGFLTFFVSGGTIHALVVGYDGKLDYKRLGLYRALIGFLLAESLDTGMPLFLSTGVTEYKKLRGTTVSLDYEAVLDRHLPPHRRAPWLAAQQMFGLGVRVLDTEAL